MSELNLGAERAAPELAVCPFCASNDVAVHEHNTGYGYMVLCHNCTAEGPLHDTRALSAEWWNRRAAPVGEVELPAVDYDRDMDRTYIPLPGGWEIQTKSKGSTFRIAHAQQQTRWQVLDENLHEPLEALARDMRNAIAPYAERIRVLEREVRARANPPESTGKVSETRMDAVFGGAREIQQKAQSIGDDPVFRQLLRKVWLRACMSGSRLSDEEKALIAYIDGRTAGAAPTGWKLVPAELTDEMRAACKVLNYADDIDAEWARLLAAAPSPQHGKEGG